MTALTDAPATKRDLEELYQRTEKMVGTVVGEVVGDALQIISERFDAVDRRMDKMDARFDAMDRRFDHLEDKLDGAIARIDHHDIDIRELKRRIA